MTKSTPIRAFSVVTLVILLLTGCGSARTMRGPTAPPKTQIVRVGEGRSYTDVSADELAALLETRDFVLINVHVPYEGHIVGTDAFVPFDDIEGSLGKPPTDRDAKLLVYCRSGGMSAIAARKLVDLGYTHVVNLDGGMIAWEAAGQSILHEPR